MGEALGTGIYTTREISRLTGLQSARVSRWVSGYSFRRGEAVRTSPPLIARDETATDGPLTFLDLIEVLFVKAFLEHGVTMPTIRRAAAKAVDLFGTHHPFAVKRFETDGKAIFARLIDAPGLGRSDRDHLVDVVAGQASFADVVQPYLRQLEYDVAGDAARWYPLGRERPVMLDPQVSFGAPVTSLGRVPTFAVAGSLSAGESPEAVARWFQISPAEVEAAAQLERRMAA